MNVSFIVPDWVLIAVGAWFTLNAIHEILEIVLFFMNRYKEKLKEKL